MSHALKVFLRVIHAKIYKKINAVLKKTQFGFGALNTREIVKIPLKLIISP